MSGHIFFVFYFWTLLTIGQLVVGSWLIKMLGKKLVDGGWAWGRIVSWLVLSLLIWFGGHLGLAINTEGGVRVTALTLVLVGSFRIYKDRKVIRKLLWQKRWFILAEEVLFTLGLGWLVWVRSHNPDILDLEKFMDAGFMQGYLRSPTLPAIDMWLAGEKINYYTFGHFMGAILTQLSGLEIAYSYNLILGVIMGLTMTLVFSATVNLIGSTSESDPVPLKRGARPKGLLLGSHPKAVIGGLVAALLVGFGGNTHALWYLIKNQTLDGYWYADATRFIYNTIHEFPAYSFIVSDLHGHVWDLPVVLLYLGLLIGWCRSIHSSNVRWFSVAMGVLLGIMAMTNTWDVLIYGMLTGIVGTILLVRRHGALQSVLGSWAVMGITMVAVALPWKLNFTDIGQGVRLVEMRSPLWQILVLWTGHLSLTLTALALSTNFKLLISKQNPILKIKFQITKPMIFAMGTTAVILLIIPELVYVKDIYPNHPRANTMFKLTYQAFILMSIIAGWLVAQIHNKNLPRKAMFVALFGKTILVIIVGGMMLFPYFGYRDYYGGLKTNKGLNGLGWMAREDPDDLAAILWLKQNAEGRSVVLEAVGESYTKFGRISVFTGLPTVLGWRVHEWLWRGGFEIPGQRTGEVKTIYEKPDTAEARELIDRYQIKYIVVGRMERETYKIDGDGLIGLGEVVFRMNNNLIVRLATQ